MTLVKDLLKRDLPPTDADAKMRKDHTLGSVEHNIKHFRDHGGGVADSLKKLHTVDSTKAKSERDRVLAEIDKVRSDIAKCLGGK